MVDNGRAALDESKPIKASTPAKKLGAETRVGKTVETPKERRPSASQPPVEAPVAAPVSAVPIHVDRSVSPQTSEGSEAAATPPVITEGAPSSPPPQLDVSLAGSSAPVAPPVDTPRPIETAVPPLPDAEESAKEDVAEKAPPVVAPAVTPREVLPAADAVSGRVAINFGSRLRDGAIDRYDLDLAVGSKLRIAGKIERRPAIVSKILAREEEPLTMFYELKWSSSQKALLGSLFGEVPITREGVYDLGRAAENSLRFLLADGVRGDLSQSSFGGAIVGRSSDRREGVAEAIRSYTRYLRGTRVTVEKKNVDPLSFRKLVLGAGPTEAYPVAKVNGSLDYDYETGNWYARNLVFAYTVANVRRSDTLSGTIKWVEDPNRRVNGRGRYEFSLRVNEADHAGVKEEGAVFAAPDDESAFFEEDAHFPRIGGVINYVDRFAAGSASDEPLVIRSDIAYALKSYGVTDQQLVNFVKLWLLITGPVNDE